MKDEKTNISQLKQRLSHEQGLSAKESSTFWDALLNQIMSGLQEDGQVRISGLGTLRIQWNEPRKSIDVNTGQEITISGYNKVVFTPEAAIKELVNQPYEEIINTDEENDLNNPDDLSIENGEERIDPLQKLGEQAEDIMDILAEINGFERIKRTDNTTTEIPATTDENETQEPTDNTTTTEIHATTDEKETQEPTDDTITTEIPATTDENETQEPTGNTTTTEISTTTDEKEAQESTDNATTTEIQVKPTEQEQQKPIEHITTTYIPPRINTKEEDDNPRKGWIITGIIISIILLLAIIAYFVFPQQIDNLLADSINNVRTKITTLKEQRNQNKQETFQEEENSNEENQTDETDEPTTEPAEQTIDLTEELEITNSESISQEQETTEQEEQVEQTSQQAEQLQRTPTQQSTTTEPQESTNQQAIPKPKPIREEANGQAPRYEIIQNGVTLAAIARKYYHGQTDFWVYIYDANRDVIEKPNDARTGMKVRIPYLDDGDPDLIIEARRRAIEYKKIK